MLQAFGLTAQMVDEGGSYVVICPGFYNQSCLCRYPESSKRTACVGCRYPGCSLKFLSTGIAAGYAVHMRWFLSEWLRYIDQLEEQWWFGIPCTDQGYASVLFLDHLDDIVLDYANVLFDELFAQREKPMYEFVASQNAFYNIRMRKAGIQLERKVCFFHGSGDSRKKLRRLEHTKVNVSSQSRPS